MLDSVVSIHIIIFDIATKSWYLGYQNIIEFFSGYAGWCCQHSMICPAKSGFETIDLDGSYSEWLRSVAPSIWLAPRSEVSWLCHITVG